MNEFIKSIECHKVKDEFNEYRPSQGFYVCNLKWTYSQTVDNVSEEHNKDNSPYVLGKAKACLSREIFGNMPDKISELKQYINIIKEDGKRYEMLRLINEISDIIKS